MNPLFSLIFIALLLVFIVASGIRIYNRLIMLDENIEKAFANIDVLLKQRADELPELVKVVKRYMAYEDDMLSRLTALRTKFTNVTDRDDKVKAYNELSGGFSKIIAVSENYPDLKASSSFVTLQERVSQVEDHIADRRELYNDSVNLYNIGIREFPAVLFAKILGYREKTLLQISEAEKQYDGIQF